jgi:hypothetical protein
LHPVQEIVYTALHNKGPYIVELCQKYQLPFLYHFDDDPKNIQQINADPGIQQLKPKEVPGTGAILTPYTGVKPYEQNPANMPQQPVAQPA